MVLNRIRKAVITLLAFSIAACNGTGSGGREVHVPSDGEGQEVHQAAPDVPLDSVNSAVVGLAGGTVTFDSGGGTTVRVEVPAGALQDDVTLEVDAIPEQEGVALDFSGSPVEQTAEVVVELGPDGTEFLKPVVVEVDLITPISSRSTRPVYLWNPQSLEWEVARDPDGSAIVGVASADGARLAFAVHHFSKYAVGSLESVFCSPLVSVDVPLLVPCTLFDESVFSGPGTELVLLSSSARTTAYEQVLMELALRTQRTLADGESSLAMSLLSNLDDVLEAQGSGYLKALKVFSTIQMGAQDALATGVPAVYGYAGDLEFVGNVAGQVKDAASSLSSALTIMDCVTEVLTAVLVYSAIDMSRASDRFQALQPYLQSSELYKKDPAFAAAVTNVAAQIDDLEDDVGATLLLAVESLGNSDCAMAIMKNALSALLKSATVAKLAKMGLGVGLVAALIYNFVIEDVILNDMYKSTKQGIALAALGTVWVYGNVYPALEDMVALGDGPAIWTKSSSRSKLLAGQCANYVGLSINELAGEVLRQADAGFLNKSLTGAVGAVGSLFGKMTRDELAEVFEAKAEKYSVEDEAIAASYPTLCSQAGMGAAIICGGVLPCIPDCSGKECGPDGCEGSCLPGCGVGESCQAGQCVEDACIPDCAGKECGPDGCEGTCLPGCGAGESCQAGECVEDACIPDCAGKECGDDGCSGTCLPGCGAGESCQDGQCSGGSCWPDCGDEVLIPAGSFWMGCNETVDSDCLSNEYPYHEVYLDAYFIDRTEVTADAYAACVSAGGCTLPGSGINSTYQEAGMEDHPVNYVDWYQAESFCAWAGKQLPTEAEWEKAARWTDGRRYPWGNEVATCQYAVMSFGCGAPNTWPVCSKSPSGDSHYEACDMAGNVWEWTANWYSSGYYNQSPASNPEGPTSGSARVFRGGGFYNNHTEQRVSIRGSIDPSFEDGVALGFRCARSE